MRIRKKPWAEYEFSINENIINSAEKMKGKWAEFFGNNNPIHIEIGCGKGQFITSMSLINTDINYIAIEKQKQIIVSAIRKARENKVNKNLVFFIADVKDLENYFEPNEIERIYINFCDPWSRKRKWAKRRLTHKNFLDLYEKLFGEKGQVFFKTDNKFLFEFSLNEIADKGWRLHNITLDLHNSSYEGNVMTEYEKKFYEKGMPIYRFEAYYKKEL